MRESTPGAGGDGEGASLSKGGGGGWGGWGGATRDKGKSLIFTLFFKSRKKD